MYSSLQAFYLALSSAWDILPHAPPGLLFSQPQFKCHLFSDNVTDAAITGGVVYIHN